MQLSLHQAWVLQTWFLIIAHSWETTNCLYMTESTAHIALKTIALDRNCIRTILWRETPQFCPSMD